MKRSSSAKKKDGPIEVKAGNVTIKIYRSETRGRALYTLAYQDTKGGRIKKSFADLYEAKIEADAVATRIQNGQVDVLKLTGTDQRLYVRAIELLKPTGVAIDLAASEYAEARRIIGSAGSVIEAARYFAKHHPVKLPAKTTPEAYEEFLEAKKSDGAAPRYLQDIRSRLGRFSKRFKGRISDLTSREMEEWLASLKSGPVARNSTRALIITFFNYAKQRGYLPKSQPTEAEGLSVAKEKPSEIGIFTPDQMGTLLKKAKEPLIAYLAIGGFAGLRHAELMRLDWSDVKLDQGFIVVSAKAAKTSQRRTIPIQPNLNKWLTPFAQATGTLFRGDGSRFLNRVTSVAREYKIEWPHNGLRHSYASYRLAHAKNAAEVSLEMGNSPQMIFRHYRELVSPQDAEKWWAIMPNADGDITPPQGSESPNGKPAASG